MGKTLEKKRKRLYEVLEVGSDLDKVSRMYDFINAFAILINLTVSIMYTFENIREQYGHIINIIEEVTVAFFAVDYCLRLWAAKYMYPHTTQFRAVFKYAFSFMGIIDFLSFATYYLPVFFPGGAIAFRMIRIVRIFRLFRINAYYDSLSVITAVIKSKKQQLISSVFIILVLMVASSLCMYGLEHEAQPEVFNNAFSGIWWSTSTLLTVGYGDIYPITTMGKLFGIVISFLGVGMVAIPTGIISAGFVNQYTTIKRNNEIGYEDDMHFIKISIKEEDRWIGKRIADLKLSQGIIIVAIRRGTEVIIPRGDVVIELGDMIILGTEPYGDHQSIVLKEKILQDLNPWVGQKIKDLDISRHATIVLVKRKNKTLIPNGNLILEDNDRVFVYTKKHLKDVNEINL